MPGFYVSSFESDVELHDLYPERCVSGKIVCGGVTAERNTLNKFMDDKAFSWDGRYLVIIEGYLLNKQELLVQYGAQSAAELAEKMYEREGETFFDAFRGSFAGAFYDKAADKWLVYTNHTGENPVFYTLDSEGGFCAGSQVTYLLDALRRAGRTLHLDEDGAYQILTFGFMERDNTFAKEIRRLRGGTYLRAEKGHAEVREYHMFHKHPERFAGKSEEELVDALDEAFRRAVELEYRKDEEYGYEHLTDMSGGLDSRMSAWVAHENKSRHMQLLTYCKANYLDEMIAKQIAQYWKDELLVKPLDDMSFIYDIDEIVAMTGGMSFYMGITGGKRMLESLNMERFGLEHTGMIGDVVIGSYCKQPTDLESQLPSGKFSEKLSNRLVPSETFKTQFDDHELYLLYTRGFQGMAGTYLIRKNYTEPTAVFMDVDFFQLCMDIPLEARLSHKLYKKWILTKYPDAAKYKWETINGKINEPQVVSKLRHVLHRGPNYVLRKLGRQDLLAAGMNPIDYWFAHDEHARKYWDTYFEREYPKLQALASEQLSTDVQELYQTGSANEKAMALTVLGAVKLYFPQGV